MDCAEEVAAIERALKSLAGVREIFFSWDAASWHASKKFFGRADEVNDASYREEHGTPVVALAPLPSCAPFLNVIEAVFSGMARAIIHNSDYASVEAAKVAIDRYFAERNDHFQLRWLVEFVERGGGGRCPLRRWRCS